MTTNTQTIQLLYKSWESLKAAHDDLDRSKQKLEAAELEMETVIYLMERDDTAASGTMKKSG